MSSKRKPASKSKAKSKSRKVEYDEEDISSEHESEVEDPEHHQENAADVDDANAEDDLADLASIPELPAPEVYMPIIYCIYLYTYLSSIYPFFRVRASTPRGYPNGASFFFLLFPVYA